MGVEKNKLTRKQGHFCRAASSRPLPASGGPFSGPATSFAFPSQPSSAAMLSRALLRAGLARNALSQVRPVSTTSAKAGAIPAWVDGVDIFENEKNPERDHVNFPRRKREELPSPVRHWWIPEEYFSFFAPKTGVTGGYIFALSFGSFLCSKEYIIFEHEMHVGMVFAIAIVGVANVVGPGLTKSMDEIIDKEISDMDSIRNKEIDRCALAIEEEEKGQWMAESYEDLISAKKENVALQLEAEYRARLKDAYTQVKRRLDYQLQTANVLRANEQKHMVDWIITNVKKSITAKQEEDALKKCVADLKALA